MKKIALLISVAAILAGCAELPSASKQSLVNGDTTARPAAQEVIATSKGSLVPTSRPAAATHKGLFEERRAVRVGDTLTVMLNETTRASKDIGTNARRLSSNGLNAGFNLSTESTATPTAINGGLNSNGNTNFDSKGGSSASNQFLGTITVTVLEVLPNGNLNVAGEKRLAVGTRRRSDSLWRHCVALYAARQFCFVIASGRCSHRVQRRGHYRPNSKPRHVDQIVQQVFS
jgi:flagellar L-ring protein FlgH